MEYYIIAQAIGFVGYIFYISAPQFKTQKHIMQVGIIAYMILCLQWYFLGQYGLLILNVLGAVVSLFALKLRQDECFRSYVPILYIGGVSFLLFSTMPSVVNYIVVIAFILNVRSQTSLRMEEFRGYALMAGCLLVCSSILAMSVPAVIFNIIFVCVHMRHLLRIYRTRSRDAISYAAV